MKAVIFILFCSILITSCHTNEPTAPITDNTAPGDEIGEVHKLNYEDVIISSNGKVYGKHKKQFDSIKVNDAIYITRGSYLSEKLFKVINKYLEKNLPVLEYSLVKIGTVFPELNVQYHISSFNIDTTYNKGSGVKSITANGKELSMDFHYAVRNGDGNINTLDDQITVKGNYTITLKDGIEGRIKLNNGNLDLFYDKYDFKESYDIEIEVGTIIDGSNENANVDIRLGEIPLTYNDYTFYADLRLQSVINVAAYGSGKKQLYNYTAVNNISSERYYDASDNTYNVRLSTNDTENSNSEDLENSHSLLFGKYGEFNIDLRSLYDELSSLEFYSRYEIENTYSYPIGRSLIKQREVNNYYNYYSNIWEDEVLMNNQYLKKTDTLVTAAADFGTAVRVKSPVYINKSDLIKDGHDRNSHEIFFEMIYKSSDQSDYTIAIDTSYNFNNDIEGWAINRTDSYLGYLYGNNSFTTNYLQPYYRGYQRIGMHAHNSGIFWTIVNTHEQGYSFSASELRTDNDYIVINPDMKEMYIDEIRIWVNPPQGKEYINGLIYNELKGDEEGLAAYYKFNGDFIDATGNTTMETPYNYKFVEWYE